MNSNRQRLKLGLGPSCKSTHSNIPYQVTFRNLTDHEVLLYWINYQGKPKFYGLLRKTKAIGEGLVIDTFVTHPWIAIDKTKLEVLSINFSNVLRPIARRDFIKEEQKIDRLRDYRLQFNHHALHVPCLGWPLLSSFSWFMGMATTKASQETAHARMLWQIFSNFLPKMNPKHEGFHQEPDADESPPEENLHLDAFITDPVLQLEVLCCLKIWRKAKTRDQIVSLQLPRHIVDQLLFVYDTLMITV